MAAHMFYAEAPVPQTASSFTAHSGNSCPSQSTWPRGSTLLLEKFLQILLDLLQNAGSMMGITAAAVSQEMRSC